MSNIPFRTMSVLWWCRERARVTLGGGHVRWAGRGSGGVAGPWQGRWTSGWSGGRSRAGGRGLPASSRWVITCFQLQRPEATTYQEFQANTTLLVICVVVFLIFLTILLAVAIFFGKSRTAKGKNKPFEENIDGSQIQVEAIKSSNVEFTLLRKKVLPHIINFPEKSTALL